ncbi:hypothetical protein IW261DRAFT_1423930 [Armillaria novae-zelandiae]|uniref:Uncharacterized protein n=1 Tax=Armillaria novae-zelandiae TaxID=153914 RepID=A0AA39UBT7_9AGAR|nr:hypothetical protein IW261DRAFT_1423930 [Armillaria novae-zelandiae]
MPTKIFFLSASFLYLCFFPLINMSGSTYKLCSAGDVAIPGDWSMSPTRAARCALENVQGRADSDADKLASPTNELLTGDMSADHPGRDIGQHRHWGWCLDDGDQGITLSQGQYEILNHEHTGGNEELTPVQLDTVQQAEALMPNHARELLERRRTAMGLLSQSTPTPIPTPGPSQDKGKIVDYRNKLATLPGFTNDDFDVDNQCHALNFWEAFQNELPEVQRLLLEEAAACLQDRAQSAEGTPVTENRIEYGPTPSRLETGMEQMAVQASGVEIRETNNTYHVSSPRPTPVTVDSTPVSTMPDKGVTSAKPVLPHTRIQHVVEAAIRPSWVDIMVTTPMVGNQRIGLAYVLDQVESSSFLGMLWGRHPKGILTLQIVTTPPDRPMWQ